jgi:uncharacterized protein YjbI with pentapeptide repeats
MNNRRKSMNQNKTLEKNQFQTGIDYSRVTIITGAYLRVFRNCNFVDSIFEKLIITYSDFVDCFLSGVRFDDCSLVGTRFYQPHLLNTTFINCNITNSNLVELSKTDTTINLINCCIKNCKNEGEVTFI